jgi:hypothetical protein
VPVLLGVRHLADDDGGSAGGAASAAREIVFDVSDKSGPNLKRVNLFNSTAVFVPRQIASKAPQRS